MKNTRMKIANVLAYIFGIGILISLFVGALSFVGYIVALIIGGDTATQICTVIYKNIYPILFSFTSVIVLLGLVKMYIAGEKSMAPKKKAKAKTISQEEQTDKEVVQEENKIK